jgi:hypothetical protein
VRLAGAEPVVFATNAIGCDVFRIPAHLARCAAAIFRRELVDTIRFGWVLLLGTAAPPASFKDSIPEINRSNLSISTCAWLRFSRSSRSAFSKLDIVSPLGYFDRGMIVQEWSELGQWARDLEQSNGKRFVVCQSLAILAIEKRGKLPEPFESLR